MDELIISSKEPKSKQIIKIIAGTYFTAFCFYFFINELLIKQYKYLFVFSLTGVILGIIIILVNTLSGSKPLLRIGNKEIERHSRSQHITIQWVNVSEMNIGVSYLLFILNGQKQQKIDLSDLTYNDMKNVKSKAVEICGFKNIPYKND